LKKAAKTFYWRCAAGLIAWPGAQRPNKSLLVLFFRKERTLLLFALRAAQAAMRSVPPM
jgi:hypothetical protein